MMQSALSHVISLPGETLPSNDRPLPPFPPQKPGEEHLAELKEDWQQLHSATQTIPQPKEMPFCVV
jgi:hypothetical protein